jgi:4'-phosphopantetheinyl transferase
MITLTASFRHLAMLANIHPMSPADCHLHPTRIDIWEFPLVKIPPQANSLLDEKEHARANRYHFERHRRRFTTARSMLRLILSRYLDEEASQLRFSYSAHGKPEIMNHPQAIEFNLSHSQELALLAVGQQFPLGIDLEFFSARPYDDIAKHLFSQQELQSFLRLPSQQKPQAFFHIWAQKEAFIKACGLGLAYPTQSFDVAVFPSAPLLITDSVYNKEWLVNAFMPKVACNAALCHHPLVKEIRYIVLDLDKPRSNTSPSP